MIRSVAGKEPVLETVDLSRVARGERLGGFIYGTIIVLAVVLAGARAYPDGPGHVAVLVAVTAVVFWLAHVYAHTLAHSVAKGEHLSLAELRYIATREGSIVTSALPSVAALLLAAVGLISMRAAVWIAFGLGLGVLAAQGIIFARVERLGFLATLVVVTVNLGLGVVLVGLKLLVSH
jgi:hypothetical protein